jgi:hypothetical protein
VIDAITSMDGERARKATAAHLGEAVEWLLDVKAHMETAQLDTAQLEAPE